VLSKCSVWKGVYGSICAMEKKKNKSYSFLLLLGAVLLGGVFIWCSVFFSIDTTRENIDSVPTLVIDSVEIQVSVVDLKTLNPEKQSLVFGKDAVFLILGENKNTPLLKIPSEPVAVLWFDEMFRVVEGNESVSSNTDEAFVYPEHARFGIITERNLVSSRAFQKGFQATVLNIEGLQ
jgi:hypothetical protein